MSATVLSALRDKREKLIAIEPHQSNWAQFQAWHSGTKPLISKYFKSESKNFDQFTDIHWLTLPWAVSGGRVLTPNNTAVEKAANDKKVEEKKQQLLEFINAIIQIKEMDSDLATPLPTSQSRSVVASTDVFVVHGHDDEAKLAVAAALLALGLNPIILHEKPNGGRTIIEKIEDNSNVGFAVVILSPNDMSFPSGAKPKDARPRARQNVILELGYFVGKLGRSRVMDLKRGDGLEVPSDFSGVVYTPYDARGAWRYELAQELRHAGFDADANKLSQTEKRP